VAWFLGGAAVLGTLLILLIVLRRHPPKPEPQVLYERSPRSVMWEAAQHTWGSVPCTLGTLAASLAAPQFLQPLITDSAWSETREVWLNIATQFATAALVLAAVLVYHAVRTPYLQLEEARRRIAADAIGAADFDVVLMPERAEQAATARFIDLSVTNLGPTSEFEAFLYSVEGMELAPSNQPALRWWGTSDKRCSITRGHSEALTPAAVLREEPNSSHQYGMIDFFVPCGPEVDVREHARVFRSDTGGDLLSADVTLYIRVTSLDPWAQREWPIRVTWAIDEKVLVPRVELGQGRDV
jgi:hypothetical protein